MIEKIILNFVPFVSSFALAIVGYRYAIKQLRKESEISLERKKYEYILEAHKSVYKLLVYTTDTENSKTILVWERTGKDENGVTSYFFRKENINSFLNELPKEFYSEGSGIFLSSEIASLLFEYRSIVYGLLLSTKNNDDTKLEIKNKEVAEKMKKIHHLLSVKIRENINLKVRDLKNM